MILAAFALGVWLAWTVGAFYRFRHRPAHRKASLIVNAAFLLGTTALLVWALLDSYRGVWPSVPTRIINFIAAPAQFWFIVALIAGSCCYAYRHEVREVIGSAVVARPRGAATHASPPEAAGNGGDEPVGKIRLSVIGAVLLLALLVYLGPDLRSRLQSLKFGNVEANFSAATQRSLNSLFTLAAPARDESGYAPNSMILELSGLNNDFNTLFTLAGMQIARHAGVSGANLVAVADRQKRVMQFYAEMASPLIEAIRCDRKQFPIRNAEIQQRLISLASQWRDFSKGTLEDAEKASTYDPVKQRQSTEAANAKTDEIVKHTQGDIYSIYSVHAGRPGCDHADLKSKQEIANGIKDALPGILKNGYVIAFIASFIASTHDYGSAIEYLDQTAPFLDRNSADPAGEMYFYVKRYEAKYYGRWYPHDSLSDLRRAREIVDRMISATTEAGSKSTDELTVTTYLRNTRAGFLNMEIFSRFHEWLEGHRLSPSDIETLEALSGEFMAWLQTQSPTALADNINDWMAPSAIHLAATGYDTLAMNDIVIGQSKNDLSRDRCARILERLATSRNIFEFWSPIYVRSGKGSYSTFRGIFRTLDAHRDLYDSVCST